MIPRQYGLMKFLQALHWHAEKLERIKSLDWVIIFNIVTKMFDCNNTYQRQRRNMLPTVRLLKLINLRLHLKLKICTLDLVKFLGRVKNSTSSEQCRCHKNETWNKLLNYLYILVRQKQNNFFSLSDWILTSQSDVTDHLRAVGEIGITLNQRLNHTKFWPDFSFSTQTPSQMPVITSEILLDFLSAGVCSIFVLNCSLLSTLVSTSIPEDCQLQYTQSQPIVIGKQTLSLSHNTHIYTVNMWTNLTNTQLEKRGEKKEKNIL